MYVYNICIYIYIWNLKLKNKPYNIEWSILNQTPSYNPNTESCSLCQTEKIHILKSKLGETLNHRSELVSRCIHSQKFRLSNTWHCYILRTGTKMLLFKKNKNENKARIPLVTRIFMRKMSWNLEKISYWKWTKIQFGIYQTI